MSSQCDDYSRKIPSVVVPRLSELAALLNSAVFPSLDQLELCNFAPDEEMSYLENADFETTYRGVIPHLERVYIHQLDATSEDQDPSATTSGGDFKLLLNMLSSVGELFLGDTHMEVTPV